MSDGDETYSCPADGCDFTTNSERGVGNHLRAHGEDKRRKLYVEELRRLADEIEQTPRATDMDEKGLFCHCPYTKMFGSWNGALDEIGLEPNYERGIACEDVLSDVRRVADRLDRTPRKVDMADHGDYGIETYGKKFGTWNECLKEAGFEPNQLQHIPDETLLSELAKLRDQIGRTPRMVDVMEHGTHGYTTYQERFGTWNKALKAAGIEPNQLQDIPTEELLEEIRRLDRVLDHIPNIGEMGDQGKYGRTVYLERFGAWSRALLEAGLAPNTARGLTDETLLDDLQRVNEELDRTPRMYDVDERGICNSRVYQYRFGSWPGALEAAGIEPHTHADWMPTGEDHYRYNGGHIHWYGPNWREQRRKAIERDGEQCQECSMAREEHYEVYGDDIDVHHNRPLTTFPFIDDMYNREWGEVNALSNLVTCCTACHTNLEIETQNQYPPEEYPRHHRKEKSTLENGQTDLTAF